MNNYNIDNPDDNYYLYLLDQSKYYTNQRSLLIEKRDLTSNKIEEAQKNGTLTKELDDTWKNELQEIDIEYNTILRICEKLNKHTYEMKPINLSEIALKTYDEIFSR